MILSVPVGIDLVSRGDPLSVITISVLLLAISKTNCAIAAPWGMSALTSAILSGSKAITFNPIDSSRSSCRSINLFGTLDRRISSFVLSAGESPINAQSTLDSFIGVGISGSTRYFMVLGSSFFATRSTSTRVVKTRCEGTPTTAFLVVT